MLLRSRPARLAGLQLLAAPGPPPQHDPFDRLLTAHRHLRPRPQHRLRAGQARDQRGGVQGAARLRLDPRPHGKQVSII